MKSYFCRLADAFLASMILVAGCQTSRVAQADAEEEIRAVLDQQVRDWNAGNLEGFMKYYASSGETRFASGGDISRGWQTVFDRYKTKYSGRAAMGTLKFSALEVTPIGCDAAEVFGRWQLTRANDAPSGLFTLLFRKTPEGWRIVHDHTSAATK
jgi:ketosteroid isomerase-like protein